MPLRVTPQTALTEAIRSSTRITSRLADLQRQASSGIRVERPSDSPGEIAQIITKKVEFSRLKADEQNINAAKSRLNFSVSQLLQIGDGLIRAKEIAIEAPQSQARETLADEVDNLLDRTLLLANGQDVDGFLYSGSDVETPPFEAVRDASGKIIQVLYQGSDRSTVVSVSASISVDVNEPGTQLFGLADRQQTVFAGTTGAAAGIGTDNAVGKATLQIRHASTTYAGGSGVQPGTSSTSLDTVIGAAGAHTLTIVDTAGDGSAGTVALNGGDPIAFSNSDTNLRVDGSSGQVVFIDTTAIAAGFSGTVDITSNGTLSTDGGQSTIPIDFSSNQSVTNSDSGLITNVDSTGILSVGDEQLDYAGSSGLFESLIQLRDELRNERGLTEGDLQETFSRRLGDIDRVRNDVLSGVGRQSVQLENLEAIGAHTQELQLQAQERISDLESADITEVILNLQAQQNLLQFTYSAVLRVLDQSLIDFIR